MISNPQTESSNNTRSVISATNGGDRDSGSVGDLAGATSSSEGCEAAASGSGAAALRVDRGSARCSAVDHFVARCSAVDCSAARDTFPSRNSLIQTFNEQKFNSLLSCIKSKIDNANLINLNYIKMYNVPDLTNYNNETIINIRSFLLNNGYFIIELEDINSNISGWKLSW